MKLKYLLFIVIMQCMYVVPNIPDQQVDMMFCYAELLKAHRLETLKKHNISIFRQWHTSCEASLLLKDLPGNLEHLKNPDFLNGNFIRIYFSKNDMLNNLDAYPNKKVTILTKYRDKHCLLHFLCRFDKFRQFQEMAQKHCSEMMKLVLYNLLQSGAEMEGIALWAYQSGKKHFVYESDPNFRPIKSEAEYHENSRPLPVGSFPWLAKPKYPNHDCDYPDISELLDWLKPQEKTPEDRLAAKIRHIQESKGYVPFSNNPGSNISKISSTPGPSSDSALLLKVMSEPEPITLSPDPEPAAESCEDMNDADCIGPDNDIPSYKAGEDLIKHYKPYYEPDDDYEHNNIYLCNKPLNFSLAKSPKELDRQGCIPNNPTLIIQPNNATESETSVPEGSYKHGGRTYIRTSTRLYPFKTGEPPRNPVNIVYTLSCYIKISEILPISIGPLEIKTDQDLRNYMSSHDLQCIELGSDSLLYENEAYHIVKIANNDYPNNLLTFEEDLNGTVKIPEELQSLYPNTCNLLQALLLKNTWYSNPVLKPQSDYPIAFIRQIDFLELRTGISGGLGNRAPMISNKNVEDRMKFSLLHFNPDNPGKPVIFMIHRIPTMVTQSKHYAYSYANLESNSTWGIKYNYNSKRHGLRYISLPVPIYEIGFYNSEGNFQTTRINSTEHLKELSDYIAQDSQVLWERLTWARKHAKNPEDLQNPIYLEEIISLIKQKVMEDSSNQQSYLSFAPVLMPVVGVPVFYFPSNLQ